MIRESSREAAIGPRTIARGTHVRGLSRSGVATCVGARLVVDGRAGNGERWRYNQKQGLKPMVEL